jgi:hypothetical protein
MIYLRSVPKKPTRAVVAAVLGVLLCFSVSGPLFAQQSPCSSNDLMRATIAAIKPAGRDAQVKTAMTFIQNWSSSLPDLMIEIGNIKPAHLTAPVEKQWAEFLFDVVKTMLGSNDQAIRLFRLCPTKEGAIKVLAWTARGDNTSLRINGANILANTVDNTTVCFVLHHLRDPTISTPGRANLLGVTRAMASYAYKEIVADIKATIEKVNANIANRPAAELTQTRKLIDDILDRVAKSSNRDADLPSALRQFCKDYPYTDQPDPI